ncbi:2-phosphosulfolactate phosphatase [Microbacterium sp. Bi128]|uniref:2-phosphosulfolactate phosphatase n=1 Tax=Microbacterium sp. Bi128 TaxID=2821115 RepID=UPI001E01A215|nr:2-phosphosulfolactate phosphatase [Microbacterium sp. Bi128]CAH0234703.1 2-phosphosulfolactate phosphatase [Microbacterium sp. Bi128]
MPHTPDALAQANYQVRLDWGEAGLRRLAPAHVVVVVQTLGLSARAIAAAEDDRTLAASSSDAERIALVAERAGAHVVVAGVRNAAAVAAHVLDVQRDRGERTSIAVIAAGDADDAPESGVRFAVEDLLGAGAVVTALGDLGIDHASPDAAVAGEGFRALRSAVRHLLTASGTGRVLADAGARDLVLAAAERDAASVVPVLREGVFAAA